MISGANAVALELNSQTSLWSWTVDHCEQNTYNRVSTPSDLGPSVILLIDSPVRNEIGSELTTRRGFWYRPRQHGSLGRSDERSMVVQISSAFL